MTFSIKKVPLFLEYLYQYLINSADYSKVSREFLEENVSIIGLCSCGGEYDCASVGLKCSKSILLFDSGEPDTHADVGLFYLHVDDDLKPFEFESLFKKQDYREEIVMVTKKVLGYKNAKKKNRYKSKRSYNESK